MFQNKRRDHALRDKTYVIHDNHKKKAVSTVALISSTTSELLKGYISTMLLLRIMARVLHGMRERKGDTQSCNGI